MEKPVSPSIVQLICAYRIAFSLKKSCESCEFEIKFEQINQQQKSDHVIDISPISVSISNFDVNQYECPFKFHCTQTAKI